MLRLRVDADAVTLSQVDHLLQGRDLVQAVEGNVVRPEGRQPLFRSQRLQLGEREVLGEPARDRIPVDRLRRPPRRELRMARDVGRSGDLVLVTRHEDAVARRDEIGLDVVGAHLDR
jgi:hypothetical protein